MTTEENTKRPYLSTSAIISAVFSLPLAKLLALIFVPIEDLLGYTTSGMEFIILLVMISLGLVLGLISFYHNEQPKILSFLATILNIIALFWLLWSLMNMPS